jgi:hypothetical protein
MPGDGTRIPEYVGETYLMYVKVNGKVHPCTGRTAHRGSRGIALFHDQRH